MLRKPNLVIVPTLSATPRLERHGKHFRSGSGESRIFVAMTAAWALGDQGVGGGTVTSVGGRRMVTQAIVAADKGAYSTMLRARLIRLGRPDADQCAVCNPPSLSTAPPINLLSTPPLQYTRHHPLVRSVRAG